MSAANGAAAAPDQRPQHDSVGSLLRTAIADLRKFDSARLDAELLLCRVLELPREALYRSPESGVSPQQAGDFGRLIQRRQGGVPLAYLTGRREFWSLELAVNEDTLIPRPETEHLVEAALKIIDGHTVRRVADLGTGSGAIALAIARVHPELQVTATDISMPALGIAQRNVQSLGLRNVTFLVSDWFGALGGERFDLICCNPPYVATDHPCFIDGEVRFEPRSALDGGADGLDAIRQVVAQAPDHLSNHGWLVLEHGYDQREPIRRLICASGLQPVEDYSDYSGQARGIVARLSV